MAKIIKSLNTTSGDPDLGYAHRTHRSKKGSKVRNYKQNIKSFYKKKKDKWAKKERNML